MFKSGVGGGARNETFFSVVANPVAGAAPISGLLSTQRARRRTLLSLS